MSSAVNSPLVSVESAPVAASAASSLESPTRKRLNRGQQRLAIVGEFLHHAQFVGQRHDGHRVGRGHLRVDELHGGVARADLFGGLHGGEIEKHRDQPAVLELVGFHRTCWGSGAGSCWRGGLDFDGGPRGLERRRLHFERRATSRQFKCSNSKTEICLRLAIFEQRELIFLQVSRWLYRSYLLRPR